MSTHTPGPWKRDGDCLVTVDTDSVVAFVNPDESPNHIADARLIAAAPALLEALNEIVIRAEFAGIGQSRNFDKARAAIAQAKGESNG